MNNLLEGPIKDFSLGIYDGPHATPKESDSGPIFLGIKNVTQAGAWLLAKDINTISMSAHLTCVLFRGTTKANILDSANSQFI